MMPCDLFDTKDGFAKVLGIDPGFDTLCDKLVITGKNSSGKSFLRRFLFSNLRKKGIGAIHLSQRGCTGEGDESTGVISANTFLGGMRTSRDREANHIIILDEPETGMGEELQLGKVNWLLKELEDWPKFLLGVVVLTNSRIFVSRVMASGAKWYNLDGLKNPEDWHNREIVPMTEKELCLAIIYNHKYEDNIEKTQRLYSSRFSNIRHLMPFSTIKDPQVFPVYANSHQFQLFIPQVLDKLLSIPCSHYVFCADDLVLNPNLNENNIIDLLSINDGEGYLKGWGTFHRITHYWSHAISGIYAFKHNAGLEWSSLLPSFDDALSRITAHGFDFGSILISSETKRLQLESSMNQRSPYYSKHLQDLNEEPLSYPMVYGYSDFFVIPRASLAEFALYCGVFASIPLFVEIAIPTAMLLSVPVIKKERVDFKGIEIWETQERVDLGDRFKFSINSLFEEHSDKLYIHPLKLSKWG